MKAPVSPIVVEFLPDSSKDRIIGKWKSRLERWYKEMLADCNCLKAFTEAGLDLEAADRVGVIVGTASSLLDESMSDKEVKVPREIRFHHEIKQAIANEARGFTFYVPGSADTRSHIFFSQEAMSDGFGNVWNSSACELRRTFVHELIHAAGAGKQDPTRLEKGLGHDDLSTWMPIEYKAITQACGCK